MAPSPRRRCGLIPDPTLLAAAAGALVMALGGSALAHDGPPFPVFAKRIVGPYAIGLWADPDATDDGSAEGQFWVLLEPAGGSAALPANTRATVWLQPVDGGMPPSGARAEPVGPAVSPQFVAIPISREGLYRVRISIEGPLGPAEAEADVEAAYAERPARFMIAVFALPLLCAGALWLKLLWRRRTASSDASSRLT